MFPDEEPDTLPEFCHYEDEGCALAPSCLDCPLPRCLEDRPRGKCKWVLALRDETIVRLYLEEKKSYAELAALFNVSRRTVERVLAKRKKARPPRHCEAREAPPKQSEDRPTNPD